MASGSGDKKSYTWVIVLVVILLVVTGILLAMRRKRAKRGGGYFGGAGKTSDKSHVMLPAGKGPHTHLVDLDGTGFGVSSEDRDHRHVVENAIDIGLEMDGDVGPADHTHDVTSYIVDV